MQVRLFLNKLHEGKCARFRSVCAVSAVRLQSSPHAVQSNAEQQEWCGCPARSMTSSAKLLTKAPLQGLVSRKLLPLRPI